MNAPRHPSMPRVTAACNCEMFPWRRIPAVVGFLINSAPEKFDGILVWQFLRPLNLGPHLSAFRNFAVLVSVRGEHNPRQGFFLNFLPETFFKDRCSPTLSRVFPALMPENEWSLA